MIWIDVTPRAARRVRTIADRAGRRERPGLRVTRAGNQPGPEPYRLSLVTSRHDDELALPRNGFDVLVARADAEHLDGLRIDYVESDAGSGFLIDRPSPARPGLTSASGLTSAPPAGSSPELEQRVAAALDDVRPALLSDGGDVDLVAVADGAAYVRLQGACSGCGAALATLTHLIEATVTRAVPEVTRTVLVA